jgi:uncharacterized protein
VSKTAQFFVPVADLDYGDREFDEEIPVAWLQKAMENTEATPRGAPGRLEVTLSKSGREIMVRGHAHAQVTMPCARTLDPVDFDLDAEIFLLLSRGGGPGTPHASPRSRRADGPKAAKGPKAAASPAQTGKAGKSGKPGPNAKKARREEEVPLAEETAATDTYDGEDVVLDPFVREFLLLELPMVPLREDLRSEATPAIERPPIDSGEDDRTAPKELDPRLAPLAALKSRLGQKKE